jgi:hypothetical protein
MKRRYRLAQLFACTAMLVWGGAPSSFAREECFQLARMGVQPGAWETIQNYFASLSLRNEAVRSRSRLIRLRADIVDLESWKERLIEIIQAHIDGSESGMGVSDDLRLSMIPVALTQIEKISEELTRVARDGNMFAAENAFKELMVNLTAKRSGTLCNIAREASSPTPDRSVMISLVQELKDELKAIAAAEEALGKYIRESNK